MKSLAFLLALAASPALAGPTCTFTQACVMDMSCDKADYAVTVDRDTGVLSTDVENLDILTVDEGPSLQIVARGIGSLDLLTIGANTALLSVHIGAGPMATTYIGSCE